MDALGLKYRESKGEAAFYGPKLDIQLADVMGHEETYSTIQVDFHLPNQFGLKYTRRGRRAASAGDDSSRHHQHHGADGFVSDRAVCGSVSAVAGAGADWAGADQRAAS